MPKPHDFCTLFDRRFLARAIALYRSLERWDGAFTLRAVCMDEESAGLLERLGLEHLRVVRIAEIERADPGLLAVRGQRTPTEYCWTAAPAVCRHVLRGEPGVDAVTYLDADLCFSSSPQPLLDELGDASVLIVAHRSTEEMAAAVGIYNVGWVTFRNDERGRAVVEWWRERCLEWCHDRLEPGRYGDQKYLDDWPERFAGVRVAQHPGAGLAPWSVESDVADGDPPLVAGRPLVYFHHSGMRVHRARGTALALARAGVLRRASGPVPIAYGVPAEPLAPAVAAVWARYATAVSGALGEMAAAGAPDDLFLPAPSGLLAARRLAQRALPASVRRAYDRLPLTVRHRIWRRVTPT